jgi:hypothetical protein
LDFEGDAKRELVSVVKIVSHGESGAVTSEVVLGGHAFAIGGLECGNREESGACSDDEALLGICGE